MRYFIYILILFSMLSCGHEFKEYPPYRVEQLNKLEQETLMNELLDSMEIEATDYLTEFNKAYRNLICWWSPCYEDRHIMELNVDSRGQILSRGNLCSLDEIPKRVREFYLFNRDLSVTETEEKIQDPGYSGYNFPFYTHTRTNDITRAIQHEKELLQTAYEAENFDIVEFHDAAVNEWKQKLNLLNTLNTDELVQIHELTHIEIRNQLDSTGFSTAAEKTLEGMYLVRTALAEEYFGASYLDLYYRSTRLNELESKQRLEAIRLLCPLRIIDEEFIRSEHLRSSLWFSPVIEVPLPNSTKPKN